MSRDPSEYEAAWVFHQHLKGQVVEADTQLQIAQSELHAAQQVAQSREPGTPEPDLAALEGRVNQLTELKIERETEVGKHELEVARKDPQMTQWLAEGIEPPSREGGEIDQGQAVEDVGDAYDFAASQANEAAKQLSEGNLAQVVPELGEAGAAALEVVALAADQWEHLKHGPAYVEVAAVEQGLGIAEISAQDKIALDAKLHEALGPDVDPPAAPTSKFFDLSQPPAPERQIVEEKAAPEPERFSKFTDLQPPPAPERETPTAPDAPEIPTPAHPGPPNLTGPDLDDDFDRR
jgi:hypothetical protein